MDAHSSSIYIISSNLLLLPTAMYWKRTKNTAMLFTHSDVLFNIPIIQLLYQSAYYYEGTHLIRTQMHLTSAPHLTKDNTSPSICGINQLRNLEGSIFRSSFSLSRIIGFSPIFTKSCAVSKANLII